MSKKVVTISVASTQEAEDLREVTTRAHQGLLYERDGGRWLLYEDEGTTTTLRFTADHLRIYRRGAMNGWQDFRPGELTGGLLALGADEESGMVLRVLTTKFALTLDPDRGRIELEYDLFTGASDAPEADPTELPLGHFTLDLVWDALEPWRAAAPGPSC